MQGKGGFDYLQLLLTGDTELSLWSLFALCFLTVGRIAPVVALSPFFGARVLATPVKIAMALCFMAILLPKLMVTVNTPLAFNLQLVFLMIREVIMGTIFGFFLSLPFLVASAAGVYIDHQRGAASLMTNDPTIQNQSSPIGTLYNMVLIAIFWGIGGPFSVLDTIYFSYDILPADAWYFPLFLTEHSAVHERLVRLMSIFATMALQLAMPAFLAILMTDTFLGILNRLAPQVHITFLGLGLKSWFAILIVTLGFFPLVTHITKNVELWLVEFREMVLECQYLEEGVRPRQMQSLYCVPGGHRCSSRTSLFTFTISKESSLSMNKPFP